MKTVTPDWLEEWVDVDKDGWHLKEDAPAAVRTAFDRYMEEIQEAMIDPG